MLIKNIPLELNNPRLIHELLNQFASVNKVLLMTNKFQAFVEFGDIECATKVLERFNRMELFDTVLEVSYSKYKSVDIKEKKNDQFAQRYNKAYSNRANEESSSLHKETTLKGIKLELDV